MCSSSHVVNITDLNRSSLTGGDGQTQQGRWSETSGKSVMQNPKVPGLRGVDGASPILTWRGPTGGINEKAEREQVRNREQGRSGKFKGGSL